MDNDTIESTAKVHSAAVARKALLPALHKLWEYKFAGAFVILFAPPPVFYLVNIGKCYRSL